MEDTPVHALDYIRVFSRRKWWLLLPIAASVLIGGLLVRFLPREFRSSATIGVTAPAVSPDLVGRPTTLDSRERVRAIELQLMSRPILAQLAKEEGLEQGVLSDAGALRLRRAIKVEVPDPVVVTTEGRGLDMFVVSYDDSDAVRAQRMTDRLVHIFVGENSKARTEQAQGTATFLQTQLRDSQTRLARLEGALRGAKEAHMGQLPEQMQANLQTLSGLRQQEQTVTAALRTEQDRLSMIVRQLDSLKQGTPTLVMLARAESQQSQGSEAHVQAIERDLAAARGMYTERHPEVQRLEEELRAAKAAATADSQRPAADRAADLKADPSYRQLVSDQDASQMRIAELERAETDARRQISVYQARVEGAPMVEQQLASVQRDYDLEKLQYSELSAKLRSAAIAENVEKGGSGEQFAVLYPASLPTEPTTPVPSRVMLLSIVAGICVGGVLTIGREYLDRSVHDPREIKDEFDLPVLGEVNHIGMA